jgi:hypothetical protein
MSQAVQVHIHILSLKVWQCHVSQIQKHFTWNINIKRHFIKGHFHLIFKKSFLTALLMIICCTHIKCSETVHSATRLCALTLILAWNVSFNIPLWFHKIFYILPLNSCNSVYGCSMTVKINGLYLCLSVIKAKHHRHTDLDSLQKSICVTYTCINTLCLLLHTQQFFSNLQ